MEFWSNPRPRWQLFHEMQQLSSAGIPMVRITELFLERPQGSLFRTWAETTRQGLARNATIPEAMAAQLDAMEYSIIAAADSSGKLADGFGHLARYYEMRTEARSAALAALWYPLAIAHVATILPALVSGVQQGNMLGRILLGLAGLYAVGAVLIVIYLAISRMGRRSRGLDRLLGMIPVAGRARRAMAMARWCVVSHFHILSGQNIAEAILAAGAASQSPVLDHASGEVADEARRGNSLGQQLMGRSEFPRDFAGAIRTAEEAGALDTAFATWADRFFEDARRAMGALALWLPKIVYAAAAILAAVMILRMYSNLYSGLFSLMDAE
jgi:type II secretory pathway component PulF